MAITGMGGYSGPSNGMQLIRNESTSDSLAAMLGPGLQAPRHVGGLEDTVTMQGGVGQKRPFFATYDGPTVEDGPEDGDDGGDDLSPGGSQLEKKRRLTFDQVRSLERNFEMENKLEPERKMQLAKELGLRPRQVAVWFQNRRARWKTKQLERDYETLAADYERLKADFEQVVGEKNHLKAEVQRLSGATPVDGISAIESAQPQSVDKVNASDFASRHHNSRSSPTVDVTLACASFKEETSGCTDGSNSSDVLDADSPRTTDSSSPASAMSDRHEHVIQSPEFPPESSFMAPGMLQDVTAGVKLEDGSSGFHEVDQSCNYLLLQLDEQSVLPWWDWP
ncbi:hypothetical protein KC19_4G251000 [Ceratodon purpureus]|uniref:Homeobox domain-containing protein n=1 Tax=Ceratodon purpureus TaxID=3225 RepID=A0A8T0IDE5_CERPU|nr:hypothetical protein KC19_4G251000 [Ceratodon purpureus]